MTISELIKKLEKYDQETLVCVMGDDYREYGWVEEVDWIDYGNVTISSGPTLEDAKAVILSKT